MLMGGKGFTLFNWNCSKLQKHSNPNKFKGGVSEVEQNSPPKFKPRMEIFQPTHDVRMTLYGL